jgi:hypothetical protein
VISTDITRSTTDGTVGYGAGLGTSGRAAVCTALPVVKRTAMPVAMPVAPATPVDVRITAELRASSFFGGHAWLRPAALDLLVQTTPGPLAWSPPT